MNILWATIGGGVGGALGYFLATALSHLAPEKWRRGIVSAVSIAVALVCGRVAVSLYENQAYAPANVERQMLADQDIGPLVQAWKEADPSSYQAFISRLSADVRAGLDGASAINTVRAKVTEAVTPRMAYLDDVQMIELARIARMQFEQLSTSRPGICKPMFLGQSYGDIRPYITDDVEARERALFEAAFRADTSAPQNVLTGQALENAISNLMEAVRMKVGDDISLIANGAHILGRERRYCQVVTTLYEEMEALPAVDAASLMRGLAAAS